VKDHTTPAVSDNAETHLVRAVNTGIIDVSLYVSKSPVDHNTEILDQIALVVQESEVKLRLLEREEADDMARPGKVDKGKSRML
jgi:hypothetical protein